ncbi:A/G-specific DNA-adenine glycosylase [Branchiibius hedensis]|uniref:Adenine DNA glycosylase n=1 Tax=Branchiibius hedensis TaxID=672460 RepID=A0A2Y8ZK97_9MICO|nr:adenine glycosylase [Branchiibius hedensis]PWJ24003.1 A/G-specific DNA-adenine glycosylase [Branchiibius hedensis]SSA32821.1 A/G-specific DNA-adenine glycosylase [Branchiibius hedensis]
MITEVIDWYADHQRDLPWRRPEADPWSILVSEVMLQQTPVARVLPVWQEWLTRWPTPDALAQAAPGEAVRAWGRLGYPRRALRLHAAATAISTEHAGQVPSDPDTLRTLPGIGAYTAAAVAAFAYGVRIPVVDTNVRRVQARAVTGVAQAAPSLNAAENRLAAELLPEDPAEAKVWNVAVMELGALVCTAARPDCARCPIAGQCAWRLADHPAYDGPAKAAQRWHGTDRQVRGLVLQALRESDGPVPAARIDLVWPDDAQRQRCVASLIEDGLIDPLPGGRYALPA